MKMHRIKNFAKSKFLKRAQEILMNPSEALAVISSARAKLERDNIKQALGNRITDLKVFLRMMKAYALGQYKDISKKHLVLCVLAVLYFLNPADVVPDVVVGLGLVDDLAVINWVYLKLIGEIEKFKNWEKIRGEEVL